MSPGDEHGYTDTARTRLRLPEDPYTNSPRRTPRNSSRGLVTVVGVVVLLIAAIAFANRGTSPKNGGGAKARTVEPQAAPTAPSGTKPVGTKTTGVPTGFAHTAQGAQSAASNYAVALGSTSMFRRDSRHALLKTLYTPDATAALQASLDKAFSAEFLARMGLDAEGNPPKNSTFVSRVVPIGTSVHAYADDKAEVAVWYTGLIGMAGSNSTDPVTSSWKTWTFDLRWSGGDWKIASDSQKNGPAPVPGDDKAATSDEISKATEEYGGFTYAR